MSLTLPADVEPFLTDTNDDWTAPAVYALRLIPPDTVAEAWDRHFDTRPDYLESLRTATDVVYVGAASNLMHRLEDHRDGQVRKSALLQVCEIEGLRNIWWFDDPDRAFERESGIAIQLQNYYPDTFVHQR